MTLRKEIWELLSNLSEFGEQDSATDSILKLFEQKIDERIKELSSDLEDTNLKILLGEEKWKTNETITHHRIGELEILKLALKE